MIEQPFFSVILPAFNRERSIVKAIHSLLEQSFENWELLIVDDASTDQMATVIAPYLKDQRILYLKNETNRERCQSRNRGIQESKGHYICFLDSDDYHLPNHLEELFIAIQKQHNEKGFFFTHAYNETESGERSERFCPPYTTNDPYTYFLRYTVNPQRWCVHREIMLDHLFDPNVIICEDMDTSLRMAAAGVPIFQVDQRTTVYVAASDSFTHGDPKKWEKELFYLKRIFAKPVFRKLLPVKEKRRLLSMCYFHLGQKAFCNKRSIATIYLSVKSFLLFPTGYNGKTNKILLNNIVKSISGVEVFLNMFKKRNTIHVEYRLPENYDKGLMASYFTPIQKQAVNKSKIKELKNVFVNHQGLVMKNGFLVPRCTFNLRGKADNTFYWSFWKLVFEQCIVSRFGKSIKSTNLKNGNYLIIHAKWFNYSFWINSYLVRLIQAEEAGLLNKIKLIYPQEWDKIPYVTESLKCFNLEREIISEDTHMFIKKLVMPETREWTASFHPGELTKVREKVLPFAKKYSNFTQPIKRLYLSRKNSRARSVANENELIQILKKYDFEILTFEDISFWDQVLIMNDLDCFISIHGAGFSNMIFMNENSAVFELVNQNYADMEYKFPFWKMATSCNLKYFIQFGKAINDNSKLVRGASPKPNDNYLVDENIYIEPNLFEKNLNLILKNNSIL